MSLSAPDGSPRRRRRSRNWVVVAAAAALLTAGVSACTTSTKTASENSPATSSSSSQQSTAGSSSSSLGQGTCTVSDCNVYSTVPWDAYKGTTVGILNLAPVPGATRWSSPLKSCLQSHGATVNYVDIGGDIAKAAPTIQGWLSSNVKAIFDIGIPIDGQASLIKQANSKKVPVVLWGAGSPPGTVALDANQTVDGVLIAEYIVNKIGVSGAVVTLTNSTNPALRQREQGALAVFSQYSGIKVIQKEVPEFSVEGAQKVAAATLQANPKVAAFIGGYGDYGVGATNAVSRANSKAIVVSMNGDLEEYDLIRAGGPFKATIADAHEAGSQLACQTGAVMLSGGSPYGNHLFMSSVFVDSSNLPDKGAYNNSPRTVDGLGSNS